MCNLICCGELQISCHFSCEPRQFNRCLDWCFIDVVLLTKKTLSKCA